MSKLLLYRCSSKNSAGNLSSGKGGGNGQRLSPEQLFTELALHIDKDNREPTALVSLTSSLARAIQLAFMKSHNSKEKDDQIVIAFIKSPPCKKRLFHHAEVLVRQAHDLGIRRFENEDPILFRSEYLAEWEISPQMVTHTITLKTLLYRYPDLKPDFRVSNTKILREMITHKIFSDIEDLWDLRHQLGYFAVRFGARAPLQDISFDIFTDLVKPQIDDDTHCISYPVDLWYDWTKCLPLRIEDFFLVQDGIDHAVLDCWLLDEEFVWKVKQYETWVVDENSELRDEEAIKQFREKVEREAIELGL